MEYEIYKRTDVANLKNIKGYVLAVQQRIIIPNITKYVAGSTTIRSYEHYPAIIENRELFQEHGGEEITLIPCLNDHEDWEKEWGV